MLISKQDLIAFEEDIANEFNHGHIKAPVHSYSNNENDIIDIFNNIREQDWVFCTWRSHYQCLLKGVPRDILKEKIMKGYSISLCFKDYNIVSSAIVGGIIPIAMGVAKANQLQNKDSICYCFIGDMTSMTGIFAESYTYATTHNLPIRWIIEDNDLSVCTDTKQVWNVKELPTKNLPNIYYYKYKNKWPHAGFGKRIQF